jgi:nitrite reductase/ring-hydroxylating ferredoxin subunit
MADIPVLPPPLDDRGRRTVLCALDDIAEPGGRAVRIKGRKEMFVVRWQGGVYAYVNSCPQTGVALDWQPDQFFTRDRDLLQCSMHHARFRVADGHCVAGPCAGKGLTAVRVRVEDGRVMLDE